MTTEILVDYEHDEKCLTACKFKNGKMVFNQNLNHALFEGTSLYKFDTISILYNLQFFTETARCFEQMKVHVTTLTNN